MQEWKKISGDFYLCEYVMMKHIDTVHTVFPDYSVWHAATTTIGGTTLIEDSWITNQNVCENNGNDDDIYVKNSGGDIYHGAARCWDVSGQLPANADISACSMIVSVGTVTTGGNVAIYRIFKPWVEGDDVGINVSDSGITWNNWNGNYVRTCIGNYWADAGAACARADGEDNNYGWSTAMTCEDTTADTDSPYEDIVNVTGVGRTAFEISVTLAQGWYDGTYNENGVLFTAAANVNIIMASIEKTWTPNSEDYRGWKFIYTVAEAGGQVILID
jgi:hypothetical protein